MRCPHCNGFIDDDDFDDDDDDGIGQAVEDARDSAKLVQADLIARRLRGVAGRLGVIIGRLDEMARQTRNPYVSYPKLDTSDLVDAAEAVDAGQLADAVCHLERYLHPSKAAKVRSARQMIEATR